MIYFDNSATTYPKPESVYKALDFANRNLAFNAGRGAYKESLDCIDIINQTRYEIASFTKQDKNKVVFQSSATESLNLIINGLGLKDDDIVYISPFEHNSIVRPLYSLKNSTRIEIKILPFNKKTWEPEYDKIEEMFSIKRPKAVLISQLSNVTGYELPYDKIFALSKQFGAINVLDSAQSYGILNPILTNCDFCVFAGHKSLYASFGIAGFINVNDVKLQVIKSGGNGSDSLNHYMPETGYQRYEAGSPNVVAIYGLLESCKWLKNNKEIIEHEKELTNYLIEKLVENNKVKLYLPDNKCVFGIVSFNIDGYLSDDVSAILYDEFGIMTRSGYHCSPHVHDFINSQMYKGTVRVSLGAFNTQSEIDELIAAIKTL